MKIKSQNLSLSTKILNNLSEIEKELKSKADYHYIQVDPFFREEHLHFLKLIQLIKRIYL